jgi:DeoR/GlpR family transcriptional regulator of sugar metabolism
MNIEDFDRPRLAEARRELIREMLIEGGAVTVSQLQDRFGVSPMTARRDLDELERRGAARRTHGGAVLPSIAAPENSFTQRVEVATDAKIRLADAAFELLRGGETVFLDSSSTAYFLARRIAEGRLPLRVLTNSGPVVQVLASCDNPQLNLFVIGGMLRRLTRSYVGPSSVRMIREHFADKLFLSVTGVTANGMLTDADDLEAAVKAAMMQQSKESILLMDESKLSARGRQAVAPLKAVSLVIADGLKEADAKRLRTDGATVRLVGEPETSPRRFVAPYASTP